MCSLALATCLILVAPASIAQPARAAVRSPTHAGPAPATLTPDAWAAATLARMTEDQRIGQLFMFGIAGSALTTTDVATIEAGHYGSVYLQGNRTGGVAAVRALTDAIQALAPKATAGVPFFVGADQEGGYVQRLTGPGFSKIPTALTQGTYAPSVLRADAAAWGRQLAAAGVNLDLAPVMDVVPPGTDASNPPIGALEREFGHDPGTVGAHGVAFVDGMAEAGVAATVKHFPGLGRVTANTDTSTNVIDSVTTSSDPYLDPFGAGVAAGVPLVMVSLATYTRIDPDHIAAFSPTIVTGLLRDRLGFVGVIASDSLTATAVSTIDPGTRAIEFLSAGGNLILVGGASAATGMRLAVKNCVASDSGFRAEVDAAALRILEAKARFRAGCLRAARPDARRRGARGRLGARRVGRAVG